jgi:hypothetical protein
MVEEKKFRSDLYYRLNVFPINVPPLRERPEDIPLLVHFFANKFAQQMRKRIESVPKETMAALVSYHWPGNIRELQNLVERAVILSRGSTLEIPLAELKQPPKAVVNTNGGNTLETVERDHILKVLDDAKWVIGGPTGAAARLGLNRSITACANSESCARSRKRRKSFKSQKVFVPFCGAVPSVFPSKTESSMPHPNAHFCPPAACHPFDKTSGLRRETSAHM